MSKHKLPRKHKKAFIKKYSRVSYQHILETWIRPFWQTHHGIYKKYWYKQSIPHKKNKDKWWKIKISKLKTVYYE